MDKKISALDAVQSLQDTDVLPIVNGAQTRKVSISQIKASIPTVSVDSVPTDSSTNPVSSNGVFDALANKVDKVAGKGLSTNDYTTTEQTKLAGIQAGAEVNVNADWNATTGDAQILNKPTIPTLYVESIVAGTNVTVDNTDPLNPIVSSSGGGGGGASVNYYINGGTSQGTIGGNAYLEMSKTAVIGTGVDFTIATNGYIANFITDVADPSLLKIPAGNWNLEYYFSSSSNGGSPSFYTELYKYDGATFTLIASNSVVPEGITNGTAIDLYFSSLAVPETVLALTDRLAIRIYVNNSSKTIKLHTQDSHLGQLITTFTSGLVALNGLTAQVQTLATGTSGTDFAISSATDTHTFNLPTASATKRGALSSADWSTFNTKLGVLQVTPITLTTGGWSLVSGLYEYTYSNANILSTSIVDVIPESSTIAIVKAADIMPATSSAAGSVKIYATNLPTASIIVTFNIYN